METIRRPGGAIELGRRGCEFEGISKIQPVDIYIPSHYRCDQVERLSGTEMQNRKRLLQLGENELV